jgi:hypothetical protein
MRSKLVEAQPLHAVFALATVACQAIHLPLAPQLLQLLLSLVLGRRDNCARHRD